MRKKFFSILAIMFIILVSFTNVQAKESLFELGTYSDIYKLSEQADIDLPFFNVFMDAATYDKDVAHSGISIGETTIDVDEKLDGMQVLVSMDMITIKGQIENAFIYANNVVIEGKITGDTIILAPNVQILKEATVEKDVIVIANNLDIKGTVEGNVIATISEKANISGVIKNDLRMIAQDLEVENADIKGDIYIETNADVASLKEKYPDAVVETIIQEQESDIDWLDIFKEGVITVVIYTVICLFVTKKDNNIVEKACKKFKENTVSGLVISVIMIMLLVIVPIILILLAIMGFGLIAWPILIAYIALILLVATTAMLIVGMTIYDLIKNKVGKYKIPVVVIIYAILFALTKITYTAMYANMAMLLLALAIVVTMITKKLPKEEKEEAKK